MSSDQKQSRNRAPPGCQHEVGGSSHVSPVVSGPVSGVWRGNASRRVFNRASNDPVSGHWLTSSTVSCWEFSWKPEENVMFAIRHDCR